VFAAAFSSRKADVGDKINLPGEDLKWRRGPRYQGFYGIVNVTEAHKSSVAGIPGLSLLRPSPHLDGTVVKLTGRRRRKAASSDQPGYIGLAFVVPGGVFLVHATMRDQNGSVFVATVAEDTKVDLQQSRWIAGCR